MDIITLEKLGQYQKVDQILSKIAQQTGFQPANPNSKADQYVQNILQEEKQNRKSTDMTNMVSSQPSESNETHVIDPNIQTTTQDVIDPLTGQPLIDPGMTGAAQDLPLWQKNLAMMSEFDIATYLPQLIAQSGYSNLNAGSTEDKNKIMKFFLTQRNNILQRQKQKAAT